MCMYVHVCIYMYVCACICVCSRISECICMCLCVYMMCVCLYMFACIVCNCILMCMYVHICVYMCVCVFMCVHMCMCIRVCISKVFVGGSQLFAFACVGSLHLFHIWFFFLFSVSLFQPERFVGCCILLLLGVETRELMFGMLSYRGASIWRSTCTAKRLL